jgi:hypothetical protein
MGPAAKETEKEKGEGDMEKKKGKIGKKKQ